jgi:hypothetical protein
MARLLYVSFTQGEALSQTPPPIPYEADSHTQHLRSADLDQLVEAMTVLEPDGSLHCMSYGQFSSALEDRSGQLYKRTDCITSLFHKFHPSKKPVVWRILIVQAHIHRALVRTCASGGLVMPADALTPSEQEKFDWRPDHHSVDAYSAVGVHFDAARRYLEEGVQFLGVPLPLAASYRDGPL